MERYVYLDNNGTTRMADEVISFIHGYDGLYGNASSMHTLGRQAAAGQKHECGILIFHDSISEL